MFKKIGGKNSIELANNKNAYHIQLIDKTQQVKYFHSYKHTIMYIEK